MRHSVTLGSAAWISVLAAVAAARADEPDVSKEELAARYPGVTPNNIRDAPLGNLYEVVVNGRVSYVSKDGRYLIQGEIIDLASRQNLTEARRAAGRAELFAQIDPATEIVFSPPDGIVSHTLFVFTDVDCGYCRQFHRDIEAVNALGVEVRYVSYPRTGPNTESWAKAEGVWCAADRRAALTRAKLGAEVPSVPDCTSTPIAAQYELGRRIGLTGTPGIYLQSGEDVGGYFPPEKLLMRLDQLEAAHAAQH